MVLIVVALCGAETASIGLGVEYEWPDNVHVRYGFPLTWAVHTRVSILGPVDRWEVSIPFLVADLLIWNASTVLATVLLLRYWKRHD